MNNVLPDYSHAKGETHSGLFLRYLLILIGLLICTTSPARKKHTDPPFSPALQQLYAKTDHAPYHLRHAPVIGISTTYSHGSLSAGYDCVKAIHQAGGIPILIPSTNDPTLLDAIIRKMDGVLFTGGVDVDPSFYGHDRHPQLGSVNNERDTFELMLFRKAFERGIPIFGICRGMQLINVAMGGTLVQDIPSELTSDIRHLQEERGTQGTHSVNIEKGSTGARMFGQTTLSVNSFHHQCIQRPAPQLKVTGRSPDGVPEVVEGYPKHKIFGVQFHPEIFAARDNDATMKRFFSFLIEECKQ